MKKIVLRLDLQDDKAKQKALKTVSTLSGISSIGMDMKEKKLTVVGTVDAVTIVRKLRKTWPETHILSVGPEKEEKKEAGEQQPKKEGAAADAKKEDEKKSGEAPKKEDDKSAGGDKKDGTKPQTQTQPQPPDAVLEMVKAYKAYNPHLTTHYYVQSMEENPNACVIC